MSIDVCVVPVKVSVLTSAESLNGAWEMSRLINAALVDAQFCDMLLTRPEQALDQGYNGETFNLDPRDRQFVLATPAASLADFANCWVSSCNP